MTVLTPPPRPPFTVPELVPRLTKLRTAGFASVTFLYSYLRCFKVEVWSPSFTTLHQNLEKYFKSFLGDLNLEAYIMYNVW